MIDGTTGISAAGLRNQGLKSGSKVYDTEVASKIRNTSIELLLSGALAGALAKSAIAPMDRIKILFQTNPDLRFDLRHLIRISTQIYSSSGIRAFWKGHTATLVRVIPYSATNFFVFDRSQRLIEETVPFNKNPVIVRFLSGAIAGSVAVMVTYPLETLRARLAVDMNTRYSGGYLRTIHTIVKSEGMKTLYSGLRPTLMGIIPYAGTSFAVYETLKSETNSFASRFLVGAVAGFIAQASTYPLDVVRRRMQVYPLTYRSISQTFKKVCAKEGFIRGLYKGLSMNLVKGPIAIAISLNANDLLKTLFASSHET
jgi:solute carrier family 25 protein 42